MDMTPEQILDAVPFAKVLGMTLTSLDPDEVRCRLDWSPERTTTGGAMNGGAIMGLADNAGGIVAFLNLPEGAIGTSTISSSTNFLRGLRDGHAEAVSRPIHKGRSTIVVETEVLDADGRLVAKVTQAQTVLR
jgi:1,4-dihydroxy-2-naphthoyl-CoA hydrolase